MPELPEVEVVRRGLDTHLVGATLGSVRVLHPRSARSQPGGGPELAAALEGCRVTAVQRRGKYLWMELGEQPDRALFVHLGMSGQMRVTPVGELASPHVRIRARLDGAHDGPRELCFVDQRTFGQWSLVGLCPDPHGLRPSVPTVAAHIGPDPLEPQFDAELAAERLRRKNIPLKRALLDQTLVSGIGNIYADEIAFRVGVLPWQPTSGQSGDVAHRAIAAAQEVLARAIDAGGTSFDAQYVAVNGASGRNSENLNVYGRGGKPCRVCGSEIRRETYAGRGTHYCPVCQTPA